MTNKSSRSFLLKYFLWLIPAITGAILVITIMVILPPDRKLYGIADFCFKLSPAVLAVLAISVFPNKPSWMVWFLVGCTLFFMGFVEPQHVIQVNKMLLAMTDGTVKEQFHSYYRFSVFVSTFTFLFALFAYRLGGGRWDLVLKLGIAGILIIISGLNDTATWLMDHDPDKSQTLYWAYHVKIFIGKDPGFRDMVLFISIHLILAIGVMFIPLRRWSKRIKGFEEI